VVNTCTVTAEGDKKSRQVIRRMARDNPDARIIVMGCYATRAPEEVRNLGGVSEVITDKRELPDLLGRLGVAHVPSGLLGNSRRARAFVKVQDGCLLRCSYCIIPLVRPHLQSRPLEEIEDEVRRLIDGGHREIILTGIHLGHYGVDLNRRSTPQAERIRLSTLVRRLANLSGEFRLRLSSIEATEVTRELIEVMAEHPRRICPHLHLCLQSGSDRILRLMRRRWSSRLFLDRCELIRRTLDQPALTTDIIVGFPSETEADFVATCQAAIDAGFSQIHAFPFSPRRDTPAAAMEKQIAPAVKQSRMERLSVIEMQLRTDYLASLRGRWVEAIVEQQASSTATCQGGTTCRFHPIQWNTVSPLPFRSFAQVQVVGEHAGVLQGSLLSCTR
jgi:threonylcarbamoyladenosine tRNA methylthiotransferase MtaB